MTQSTATVLQLERAPESDTARQLTDLGNAKRFVRQHGDVVRYATAWNEWITFDGRRWAVDENREIDRRARDTVHTILEEITDAPTKQERAAILRHYERSASRARIVAMKECVVAEEGIAVRADDLDQHPMLLCVADGVVDLTTGDLRAHDRELLLTKLVPIRYATAASYDPQVECPTWLTFLDRVLGGDRELIGFLQRAFGYSLTGDTREQCLFFLHGPKATGKSTTLGILQQLLGEYAQHTAFDTLLEKRGNAGGTRADLIALVGARVVTAVESSEGRRLDESLVKELTGQDRITARGLWHRRMTTFEPTFKIWLASNNKPTIRETDGAIWRRIRLVPFVVEIPEAEWGGTLRDRLRAELPGILRWAVEGCLDWLECGLRAPETVRRATQEYQRESDTFGQFLSECCEIGEAYFTPGRDLYARYVQWWGGSQPDLKAPTFGKRLAARGFAPEMNGRGSDRVNWYHGLRLSGLNAEVGQMGVDGAANNNSLRAKEIKKERIGNDYPKLPHYPGAQAGPGLEPWRGGNE